MAYTDINTEDRLVQKTFADHLRDKLGWDSVYAWNDETFGPAARMAVLGGRLRGWATRIEDQTEVSFAYASLVETRACPLCGVCAGVLGNNIERLCGGRPLRRLAPWQEHSS